MGPLRLNPGTFGLARLGRLLTTVEDVVEAIEQRLRVPPPGRLLTDRVPLSEEPPMGAWGEEHKWMVRLTPEAKGNFLAKRYMDDILLFYAEAEGFEHSTFLADFEEPKCYEPPLYD